MGREIKKEIGDKANHGTYDFYGVIFYEELADGEKLTQKNVTVFADGQIDRSPCGSGTCARLALLLNQGKVSKTKKLSHHSIVNTIFDGGILEDYVEDGKRVCIPYVTATANLTGQHKFYIDESDPVCFLFR